MKIEVEFTLKSNILSWSNQNTVTHMSNGTSISISIKNTSCNVCVENALESVTKEYFYIIWELLALYDGYFYQPLRYTVDGAERDVEELFAIKMYKTDQKWIDSALLIGRNQRDFSEKLILNYKAIKDAGRKQKSMDRSLIFSYFYLLSEGYVNVNIEHRLVLLMNLCDGFALSHLNGNSKHNAGNINVVLGYLDKIKYKHGAELLGVDSGKAINAIGDTRNELTHYVYKEHSLGSYIADPNSDTDNTINLYVFYVLELALRTAILETIGFYVTDEVRSYLLDENLDWIRIQKDIDEDCQIAQNRIKQILRRLEKAEVDNK